MSWPQLGVFIIKTPQQDHITLFYAPVLSGVTTRVMSFPSPSQQHSQAGGNLQFCRICLLNHQNSCISLRHGFSLAQCMAYLGGMVRRPLWHNADICGFLHFQILEKWADLMSKS